MTAAYALEGNREVLSECRFIRFCICFVATLQLLDVHYADPVVREYAVSILRQIPEHDLITYLLQLTQVSCAASHPSSNTCDPRVRNYWYPKLQGL